MASRNWDEQAALLRAAAGYLRQADKALNRVAESDPKLCRLVEEIRELEFVEPALADRVESLASVLSREPAPLPSTALDAAVRRHQHGVATQSGAITRQRGRLRPVDVALMAQTLRDLAGSFDAVVAEAARSAGITGYDNVVSDTLGDGLITELDMLAEKLGEDADEAELVRRMGPSRVVHLLSEAAREDYPTKPPAPSRSRATPGPPASIKLGNS